MRTQALALNNEIDIIEKIVSKSDDRAITLFVRANQSFVFHTALRYLKDYDEADDLTQEVFIKAIDNIAGFRQDSSVKTWLYRITTNMCKNALRKKKVVNFLSFYKKNENSEEEFIELKSEELTPHTKLEFKETEETFLNAYAKLPDKQRETFALRYFDNLTYEEISQILGTSTGGLKANYFQAVKKISDMMKQYNGDENGR